MSFGDELPPPTTEERSERLNDYVERLRADQRPTEAEAPNAEEASIYQMAALFRAAAPDAADPSPSFAASLFARLQATVAGDQAAAPSIGALPQIQGAAAGAGAAGAPAATPYIIGAVDTPDATTSGTPAHRSVTHDDAPPTTQPTPITTHQARATGRQGATRGGVSRRGLLTGGLSAAAAAVVGVAAGAAIERAAAPMGATTGPTTPLVQKGAGVWVAIAPVADIPVGAVKHFQTEYIVGFIRHTAQGFSALSGVCTHMSCLLVWNTGARTFDCPCHGGRFNADGRAAASSPIAYSPLPAIETKVEGDQVWVYVIPPLSPTTPSPSSGGYGADTGGN